jgi:hypothetical protein
MDVILTQKKFANKSSFKKWLISATGIVLTSVSLMSDVQDIDFQFSNPQQLSTVIEGAPEYFPEGEYLVTFKNSEDIDQDDLDFSKMVMVISLEAKVARSNTLIGGLKPLLKKLAEFDYCCAIDKSNPAYVTAGIWVVEPTDINEIESLKNVLQQYSVFYAFNDGSGFVTLNNARHGNGVQQVVKI